MNADFIFDFICAHPRKSAVILSKLFARFRVYSRAKNLSFNFLFAENFS